MIGMSFALRGGERRACVKWRVKWWLERAREVEAWRICGKSPVGANAQGAFVGRVVRGCPDEGRGRAFYFAVDTREKPCRGKYAQGVFVG